MSGSLFKKRAPKQVRKREVAEEDEDQNADVVVKRESKRKHGLSHKLERESSGLEIEGFEGKLLEKSDGNHAVFDAKKEEKVDLNSDSNKDDDGLYRGQKGYKTYIEPREKGSLKAPGPVRNPENVRVTARFDYQPDICKDYKETGFCGYGDSCKFLHDRGDYKFGWQIEKDFEASRNVDDDPNRYLVKDEEDQNSDDEENLPFACFICRGPFVNPIVTRCNHYFCESCALKHYAKSSKCFVCSSITNGQFSVAKNLLKALEDKKIRLEEERLKDIADLADL